ncbi:hypothetical protein V1520DRAFT_370316 [Lipomyces starkeyi]|uniref:Uncharacterized protein n=1 Tax=Lipomyces starkeyi NRRL Y-11557 TaxID=675824 RepID=A0A1E3PVU3_LIPST|nr:hypothetical protein LIPSTDRAFT_66271 [Lipomyces starkeyi NRRL Y-11557]
MGSSPPITSPVGEFYPHSQSSEPSTPRSSIFSSYSSPRTVDTSPSVESSTPRSDIGLFSHANRFLVLARSHGTYAIHDPATIDKNRTAPHNDTAVVVDDDASQYECEDDSVDFNLGNSSEDPMASPPPEYLQRQLEVEGELDSEDEFGNIVDLIDGPSQSTAKVIMERVNNASNPSTVPSEVLIVVPELNVKLDSRSSSSESRCVSLLSGGSHFYSSQSQSSNRDSRRVGGGRSAHKSAQSFLGGGRRSLVPYEVVPSSFQTSPKEIMTLETLGRDPLSSHPFSLFGFDNVSVDCSLSIESLASLNLVGASEVVRFGKRQAHVPQFSSQLRRTHIYVPSLNISEPLAFSPSTGFEGLGSAFDSDVEMVDCDYCEVGNEDVDMMDADKMDVDIDMPHVLLEMPKYRAGIVDDSDIAIYFTERHRSTMTTRTTPSLCTRRSS